MAHVPIARSAKHGRQIFVYSNLRTNQTIYSLSWMMKNNDALRQIPYLGKKTVPAALRKDLWQPLATITFPTCPQGLTAYHKLREYRKIHETAYPTDYVKDEKTGGVMSKKKRGRKLMDQKANSIADIAAVLLAQDKALAPVPEAEKKPTRRRGRSLPSSKSASQDAGGEESIGEITEGAGKVKMYDGTVQIRWGHLLDAEYAESWPENVLHDEMPNKLDALIPRELLICSRCGKGNHNSHECRVKNELPAAEQDKIRERMKALKRQQLGIVDAQPRLSSQILQQVDTPGSIEEVVL
ncbi:MAG: hypothetical protein M1827_006345 [Pycnora praestabilis]|nr:MAG: hypothetical protein M1827_006345 [Pycnora praestabilis]